MDESIEILSNSSSTIDERLQAVTTLNQYKADLEHVCDNASTNTDINVTMDNVNSIMIDASKKLERIDYNNLNDINKLYSIKHTIEKCNKVLSEHKPNVILLHDDRKIDITNKIKTKFVIADLLNETNNDVDDMLQNNTPQNDTPQFGILEDNNDMEELDIIWSKLFSYYTDMDYNAVEYDYINDLSSDNYYLFPKFNFKDIDNDFKVTIKNKKYKMLRYEYKEQKFEICLQNNKVLYCMIVENNKFLYICKDQNVIMVKTNNFEYSQHILEIINIDTLDLELEYNNVSIDNIINQIVEHAKNIILVS